MLNLENPRKIVAEYIWLDGYEPEPNLRSKTKIIPEMGSDPSDVSFYPVWSFDGSSTKQAEGNYSDCLLSPVRVYKDPSETPRDQELGISRFLVLCEVLNPDGTPHSSNTRSIIKEDPELWLGFEQEYTLMKNGRPVGFPEGGYPEPQGKYYCGVGKGRVSCRSFVEAHVDNCLRAGIDVTGANAEVLPGQWEYQVMGKGNLKACDDLWVSRFILYKMTEPAEFSIELHPKPVSGDWNGSGLHCNFSNLNMREKGGRDLFIRILSTFEERSKDHIKNYGSDNHLRLTGYHETQSISKFTFGVSDRGASIRIPLSTEKNWTGYLEDRRPSSNADPYKISNQISISLEMAEYEKQTGPDGEEFIVLSEERI